MKNLILTSQIHAKVQNDLREKVRMSTSSFHKELTPGARRLHFSHVQSLKAKLKAYGTDPFAAGQARNITTGERIDFKVIEGLLNAPKLGDTLYKDFIQQRLVTGEVDFYRPIKKAIVDTGLKKKAKPPKTVTVLKQDRQAFGTLLSKSVSLEEAFAFPATSVPLSIANPDSTLRQSSKHLLRNHLIEESHSVALTSRNHCRWIVDGMAAMRSLKAKGTYRQWLLSFLRYIKPVDDPAKIMSIEIINDTYKRSSVKSGTRCNRGEQGKRVRIEGFGQNMVQGNDWLSFFNHIGNKSDLIKVASRFFRQSEVILKHK